MMLTRGSFCAFMCANSPQTKSPTGNDLFHPSWGHRVAVTNEHLVRICSFCRFAIPVGLQLHAVTGNAPETASRNEFTRPKPTSLRLVNASSILERVPSRPLSVPSHKTVCQRRYRR